MLDLILNAVSSGARDIASRPVLALTICTAPLWMAAALRASFPQMRLVAGFAIPTVMTATLLWRDDMLSAVLALDLVLLLLAGWDLFSCPGAGYFHVERHCSRIASLRRPHSVRLQLSYRGREPRHIWVKDDLPSKFEATPTLFSQHMRPRSRAEFRYELRASRRGAFTLERVYLRVRSRLGFWQRGIQLPAHHAIHVYPDMRQLTKYAVLARTDRLSLMGVRRTRKIGQDNEFERLRDYTLDDNYKHLDWRATARRHRLTVKDFQSSQSQRVIFLMDCGRMMTNVAHGLSLLDHALNSMLMLSYVALQKGDAVGMIAFSDAVHAFVPPRGGPRQMNQLLHASFDRFPRLVESRYDQAFVHLATHCPKRSLVILITNVMDEVNADQIHRYLSSISGRHLPLGVLLRDRHLFDAAEIAAPRATELYISAAAARILSWRHQVLTALEHEGVLSLDAFPEDLTAPLLNRYLEIKARHLL